MIKNNVAVIFDSGTTAILADETLFGEITSTFTGNSSYSCSVVSSELKCNCNSVNDMLKFSIVYNGIALAFEAKRLWTYSSGSCTLNINTQSDPGFLLGDYFMTSYYTIHDMDNKKISFAPAVVASTSSSSSFAWKMMISGAWLLVSFS